MQTQIHFVPLTIGLILCLQLTVNLQTSSQFKNMDPFERSAIACVIVFEDWFISNRYWQPPPQYMSFRRPSTVPKSTSAGLWRGPFPTPIHTYASRLWGFGVISRAFAGDCFLFLRPMVNIPHNPASPCEMVFVVMWQPPTVRVFSVCRQVTVASFRAYRLPRQIWHPISGVMAWGPGLAVFFTWSLRALP